MIIGSILIDLQFNKKYVIMLTDSKRNVTILLRLYYILKKIVIYVDTKEY